MTKTPKNLFLCGVKTRAIISKIAIRANEMSKEYDRMGVQMDITAAFNSNKNVTVLALKNLLNADTFNFMHDIYGINQHLNHDTGKIENCFLPRCARTASHLHKITHQAPHAQ